MFDFFDPSDDVAHAWRNLPHWQQSGKTYFITWRTADSLPRSVLNEWYVHRNDWLRRHAISTDNPAWREAFGRLPPAVRADFHRIHIARFHRLLDDGHGACVLRRPRLARIVGESLMHFDGARYDLADFVVMPNHVHLLVGFRPETDLGRQCRSWKHFTARRINR